MEQIKSKLDKSLSIFSEFNRRLAKIEADINAIAESEKVRSSYLSTAAETMRRAADSK